VSLAIRQLRKFFFYNSLLCASVYYSFRNAACTAFAERTAQKEYLAVVHGHIDVREYPVLSQAPDKLILPMKPHVKDKKTPGVDASGKKATIGEESWQDIALRHNLQEHFGLLQQLRQECGPLFSTDAALAAARRIAAGQRNDASERALPGDRGLEGESDKRLTEADLVTLNSLSKVPLSKFTEDKTLRKKLRKILRRLGLVSVEDIVDTVDAAVTASLSNAAPLVGEAEECSGDQSALQQAWVMPAIDPAHVFSFRLAESDTGSTFFCTFPLCEAENDFRVFVAPGVPCQASSPEPFVWLDYPKNCETQVEVLECGVYSGMPVTKLRLRPLTGRRHQLRVHCLALGHPIGTLEISRQNTIRNRVCVCVCVSPFSWR
jgi:hypothetical protein